jgi:predicted RNA polymerase sigma factor
VLRPELSGEPVRLARAVHDRLLDEGAVSGLLALMVLTEASNFSSRPAEFSASPV